MFSFTASFDLGAEVPAPASDAQESLPDTLPPCRILAADDSETNRLLLEIFLRDTPWELTFARDGREAVDIWSRGRFDLVLLDVQMPVMDGYEALREIRRQEKASGKARTPIVVISAGAFDDDRRRSQEAGGDDYLAKPMKKHQLHQVILANLPKGAAAPSSLP
jgi:CheY-like chemotaxis protein